MARVDSLEHECLGSDCVPLASPLVTYTMRDVIKGEPQEKGMVRLRGICPGRTRPVPICLGATTCTLAPKIGSEQLFFVVWGAGETREATVSAVSPEYVRQLKETSNKVVINQP